MSVGDVQIVDVGHGNSAVVRHGDWTGIVDGGRGATLVELLESQDLFQIDEILVSHADYDHIGGITTLLLDDRFTVSRVFVNTDSRETKSIDDFLAAGDVARRRCGTQRVLGLTSESPGTVDDGDLSLEVISPAFEQAFHTASGKDDQGRLSANANSAVVRLSHGDSAPSVLLCADMEVRGYDRLVEANISATILVFPHHGGLPEGADPATFATALVAATQPDTIIFSIGRGRYGTPRPEIIASALDAAPGVHVMCTQLSGHCAAELPPEIGAPLSDRPGKGGHSGSQCAGTIRILLSDELDSPSREEHRAYIEAHATQPLCLTAVPASPNL